MATARVSLRGVHEIEPPRFNQATVPGRVLWYKRMAVASMPGSSLGWVHNLVAVQTEPNTELTRTWHGFLAVVLQIGLLDRETTEMISAYLGPDLDVHSVMAGRLGTHGMPLMEFVEISRLGTAIAHLTAYAEERIDHRPTVDVGAVSAPGTTTRPRAW